MKRITFLITLMLMSSVIFAQVDSTFVQQIGDFVGSIFGSKAGDSVVIIIFKVLGILAALDWVIALVITLIPTASPTRSVFEKILAWIRSLVGDKKTGGGTFK